MCETRSRSRPSQTRGSIPEPRSVAELGPLELLTTIINNDPVCKVMAPIGGIGASGRAAATYPDDPDSSPLGAWHFFFFKRIALLF